MFMFVYLAWLKHRDVLIIAQEIFMCKLPCHVLSWTLLLDLSTAAGYLPRGPDERKPLVRRAPLDFVSDGPVVHSGKDLVQLGFAADARRQLTYSAIIQYDAPVAYWRLNENYGTFQAVALGIAGSELNASISGNPTYQADSLLNDGDKAFYFTGAQEQKLVIPSSTYIDSNVSIQQRTIEMWIQPGALTTTPQIIYTEGDETRGITIFATRDATEPLSEVDALGKLFMFVYNRGDGEVNFGGTGGGDSLGPLFCQIHEGRKYYIALVFDGRGPNANYRGYYKDFSKPIHMGDAIPCGSNISLPMAATLHRHASPTCLAGLCGKTRLTPFDEVVDFANESDHNFHGTIDEVAIYNTALPPEKLILHSDAADGM